jgi:hypothetical protein
MSKKILTRLIAVTAIAVGSFTLSNPAQATTTPRLCTVDLIGEIVGALCPYGGTASNIQQTAFGCSFDVTCD